MRKILWWVFIAAMLSVFCYSGWNLYSYWKEENTAGQTFDSITEIYQKAEEKTIPDVPPESPDAGYEEPISKEELETTPGTGEEVFNAMLDDLLTVMEYVDTQNLFINLMEYGVPLGEVVKEFSNGAFQDMEQMLTRWEQYAKEAGCSV